MNIKQCLWRIFWLLVPLFIIIYWLKDSPVYLSGILFAIGLTFLIIILICFIAYVDIKLED